MLYCFFDRLVRLRGGRGRGKSGREDMKEWMDGWMGVQWLETPGIARCNTNTLLQQVGSGLKEWKEGGAVVGNECEFAIWQNKITVTGWLASPAAATIVVVETDGEREKERVTKNFLVSLKSNVIFLFYFLYFLCHCLSTQIYSCYASVFRKEAPPLTPPSSSPLSIFIVEVIFLFLFPLLLFGQDLGNVFYSTIYCMYCM